MGASWTCWKCGVVIEEPVQAMPRLAQCRQCGADLHVCRMCRYYNPRISGKCDNDQAEPSRDTDTANFCGYLEIQVDAYLKNNEATKQADAAARLAALFGDPPSADKPAADDPMEKLKALLKKQ